MGGLEAVITAKKWTEVSQPFHFPASFTSKSFTLRKMYTRLLHDYEQVYFHRNTGPPTLPPGESHLEGTSRDVMHSLSRSEGAKTLLCCACMGAAAY